MKLEEITLETGKHKSAKEGVCVMEAVSILAREPFTDYPACVDRAISRCAQVLNDQMPKNLRNELLKPLILDMIGTATDDRKLKIKRAFIAADWAVRIILPVAFDIIGKKEWAEKLRLLEPIVDRTSALIARDKIKEVSAAAAAASAAAEANDAYAAVAYAAYAAAYAAAANDAVPNDATAAATAAAAAYDAAAAVGSSSLVARRAAAAKRKIFSLSVDMLKAMISCN